MPPPRRAPRSLSVPGVVETSNNLVWSSAPAQAAATSWSAPCSTAAAALADEIVSLFALSGTAALSGHYPGWAPNPASPLLARCQRVFAGFRAVLLRQGDPCRPGVRHHRRQPSGHGHRLLRPTIRGAHAPGERVRSPRWTRRGSSCAPSSPTSPPAECMRASASAPCTTPLRAPLRTALPPPCPGHRPCERQRGRRPRHPGQPLCHLRLVWRAGRALKVAKGFCVGLAASGLGLPRGVLPWPMDACWSPTWAAGTPRPDGCCCSVQGPEATTCAPAQGAGPPPRPAGGAGRSGLAEAGRILRVNLERPAHRTR
jgi:hypothetical protein